MRTLSPPFMRRLLPQRWQLSQLWVDPLIASSLIVMTLVLYAATLLPNVGLGDTAEFQRVVPTLGLAHPTGYPLYTILGWLWCHLPLGGTPAWRMNLFSAVAAAGVNGVLYLCARALAQPRTIALTVAVAHATALTFWMQATIAEVYALAALLQASLFLALWRWRAQRGPLALVGALCGLALVHHRTAIFLLPGVVLFVVLTRRPTWREIVTACTALCAMLPIYLYVPLRLPPELCTWQYVFDYISGRYLAGSAFDGLRFCRESISRLRDLLYRDMLPQLTIVGSVLAGLGALRIWRDRASALLLLSVYLLIVLFSAAYYVTDTEVFLLPAHLVAALLLGEGVMLLLAFLPTHLAAKLIVVPLAIPLVLVLDHAPTVRSANMNPSVAWVRAIMAQPLQPNALFITDSWYFHEALHYLQEIEGVRPDLEIVTRETGETRADLIAQALDQGRPVYLLRPISNLRFGQILEGMVWRVTREPVVYPIDIPSQLYWMNGVTLAGYTIDVHPYQPGEMVPITLAWQALNPVDGRTMVFIHLVGPDGVIWGQQDYTPAPLVGAVVPEQQYVDFTAPMLSPQAPAGRYRVNIGWYDGSSLLRVALADPIGQPVDIDVITLVEIEVVR
ncbi:MAG: DUF2723 domain-containing protein [Oscillochloris sp.]|nr:DUF2723 domain-containing protein [Oscillochloris sp.]